jgi:Tfp pilus assembly protein PilV
MKKNLKSKILNLKSGFTIIETLVATIILTIALIPLLMLITSSIFSAKLQQHI